jgi:hypothetical protein
MVEVPMALWRDPLDELIDGLEQAVPPPCAATTDVVDLVSFQLFVTTILYGSDEQRERMHSEPWYVKVQQYFERLAPPPAGRAQHSP